MSMNMNRVLKILHLLVLAYTGVVSTLLLAKDASPIIIVLIHVLDEYLRSSYLLTSAISIALLIIILKVCFLYAIRNSSFFDTLRIISIFITRPHHFFVNSHAAPHDQIPTQTDQIELYDHPPYNNNLQLLPPDHHHHHHHDLPFQSMLEYSSENINDLVGLFDPTSHDDQNQLQKVHTIQAFHDDMLHHHHHHDVNEINDKEQQTAAITTTHDDQIPADHQTFLDTLQAPNYDHDQLLTMVQHQEDMKVVVDNNNNNNNNNNINRWAHYKIFDHHDHQIGQTYTFDNVGLQAIQSNDTKEELVDANIQLGEELETKSLDETWKDIQHLLSPTQSRLQRRPSRDLMMPPTPRRIRKVAKLKSSSIIDSRDTSQQWKDKKKTLSFNEEVYLRQRGGMVRTDISSEDVESLNKKFDDFIAKNKQQLLIQRQESHQRSLGTTQRGGG